VLENLYILNFTNYRVKNLRVRVTNNRAEFHVEDALRNGIGLYVTGYRML